MISPQLISRDRVEQFLTGVGCTKITSIDDCTELWMTDFGHTFTVPAIGDDKVCPKSSLAEIMDEIQRLRP